MFAAFFCEVLIIICVFSLKIIYFQSSSSYFKGANAEFSSQNERILNISWTNEEIKTQI